MDSGSTLATVGYVPMNGGTFCLPPCLIGESAIEAARRLTDHDCVGEAPKGQLPGARKYSWRL